MDDLKTCILGHPSCAETVHGLCLRRIRAEQAAAETGIEWTEDERESVPCLPTCGGPGHNPGWQGHTPSCALHRRGILTAMANIVHARVESETATLRETLRLRTEALDRVTAQQARPTFGMTDLQAVTDVLEDTAGDDPRLVAQRLLATLHQRGWAPLSTMAMLIHAAGGRIEVSTKDLVEFGDLEVRSWDEHQRFVRVYTTRSRGATNET